MSALDSLSVASNVLQVVGFTADTVFRAGKKFSTSSSTRLGLRRGTSHCCFSSSKRCSRLSPTSVCHYRTCIIPFAQDDGHTLPNISTILTLIEQDFRYLRRLLKRMVGSGREGWFLCSTAPSGGHLRTMRSRLRDTDLLRTPRT